LKITLSSIVKFFIFLGIGCLLIWLSLRSIDADSWDKMLVSFKEIKYRWLIVSVILAISSHLSRAMRWKMLLDTFGTKVSLVNSFFSLMSGYIINLAFPRMGEAARAGLISRYEKIPMDKAIGTIITERAIDVLSLAILTTIVSISEFDVIGEFAKSQVFEPLTNKLTSLIGDSLILVVIAGIIGIGILFLLYKFFKSFFKKLQGVFKRIMEGVISVKNVKNVPLFLFHSIYIWSMYYCMIFVVFFAFNELQDLGYMTGLGVLCFGSFGVIVAPGGLGAYPLIVSNLLELYGINIGVGVAFGWVTWAVQTSLSIIGGVVSLLLLPIINRNEKTEDKSVDKSVEV